MSLSWNKEMKNQEKRRERKKERKEDELIVVTCLSSVSLFPLCPSLILKETGHFFFKTFIFLAGAQSDFIQALIRFGERELSFFFFSLFLF